MSFGLNDSVIEKIRTVFSRYIQIERVILYGSRAKGNYENGSDIDLTILGNNITLSLNNRIENDLDELLLPYKIDLSIFSHIKNSKLLEHIERVGIDFYKR